MLNIFVPISTGLTRFKIQVAELEKIKRGVGRATISQRF